MRVEPLRNQVLLELAPNGAAASKVVVLAPERAICRFRVVACGPEVRDIRAGQIVLANRLAATVIGDQLLLPESAILGMV